MTGTTAEREDRRLRWIVGAGMVVLRLLAMTWRFRLRNGEALARNRRAGQPVIFALWHGQLLPLMWFHRDQGIAVVISEHRDGEIVARVAAALGFRTIRGSTTRGAGRALIGLSRELAAGRDVAVTPDGPRGPARRFAPGALVASQRAGAPILPTAASVSRAWHLRSWDRFVVPKPFARITVAYGEPRAAQADSPREAVALAPEFEALIDAAVADAER